MKVSKLQEDLDRTNKMLAEKEAEVDSLTQKIKNIENEPEEKYSEIEKLIQDKDYDKSIAELENFIKNYPCNKRLDEAKKLLSTTNKSHEEFKKKEANHQNQIKLGFAKLKSYNNVSTKNTTLGIKSVKKSKTFVFDRYDYYYFTRTADKDSIFITIDFSVTTKSKDPKLPSIYLGRLSNEGKVVDIKLFDIEFFRWSGYGQYIGLYHDKNNDFSTVSTIRFSGVAEIPDDKSKYIVFTDSTEIYELWSEKHRRPPLSYVGYKQIDSITLEEFIDNYKLIKIIN